MTKRSDKTDDIPVDLDWSKAKRGTFAKRLKGDVKVLVLDEPLSKRFKSVREIERALRDYLKRKATAN